MVVSSKMAISKRIQKTAVVEWLNDLLLMRESWVRLLLQASAKLM